MRERERERSSIQHKDLISVSFYQYISNDLEWTNLGSLMLSWCQKKNPDNVYCFKAFVLDECEIYLSTLIPSLHQYGQFLLITP